MIDFNSSASLSGRLQELVDQALETERDATPAREYLGASRLGAACERQLQYEYAKAPVDGVLIAGPEGFAYPSLWENKCLGAKSWRDVEKHKLAVSKPIYAAQIALYQSYLELHEHPALFTAVNADTMEIYAELIPFDAALAQRMSDRAARVITASEAGDLLPRSFTDSTHVDCKFCAWADRCWRSQP